MPSARRAWLLFAVVACLGCVARAVPGSDAPDAASGVEGTATPAQDAPADAVPPNGCLATLEILETREPAPDEAPPPELAGNGAVTILRVRILAVEDLAAELQNFCVPDETVEARSRDLVRVGQAPPGQTRMRLALTGDSQRSVWIAYTLDGAPQPHST